MNSDDTRTMVGRVPAPGVGELTAAAHTKTFPVSDYCLSSTLSSGQAFRWRLRDGWWTGVIAGHWLKLRHQAGGAEKNEPDRIIAETNEPIADWRWLVDYLRLDEDLTTVVASFPDDEPMRQAIANCRGLRLLRQDPWECLASFILSSTKQIVQIQQIVGLLCERFGEPLMVLPGHRPEFSFPTIQRLAACSEADLRACKMGFRAPYLLGTACMLANGEVRLSELHHATCLGAREELLKFPGVGRKIADCVLLFAYGFQQAFPVDVWVMRALRELYFPRRNPNLKRLHKFAATHFGPNAGYAQQYLFHYMRQGWNREIGPEGARTQTEDRRG
jgi:N-glycosylase/DNA lyase